MAKRKLKLAVISDVHLGTFGCHAEELLKYLKSIDPETLILNGDIFDIWNMSKYYFPESHWKILQRILKMIAGGTNVVYITGNHDEMLRKFSGIKLANFNLTNKLVLEIDGKKHWFFHGDVFDVTMRQSKWLAKLGGRGYDLLILLNRFVNHVLEKTGRGRISFSKKVKDSVKAAVKHISNFEQTAAEIAIRNHFDYVICGHIHEPVMKTVTTEKGSVVYMNSGDWVENLTVLEYNENNWSLVKYSELMIPDEIHPEVISQAENSANLGTGIPFLKDFEFHSLHDAISVFSPN